jgi:hypothetical protein
MMNEIEKGKIQRPWRLRASWKILIVAYIGLAAASWGILSQGADLSTANGRYLLAGALANMTLVAMGIIVAITAYRKGQRWAWYANSILIFYGITMISVDSYYVGFWSFSVLPQVLGSLILVIALLLPIDIFLGSKRKVNENK